MHLPARPRRYRAAVSLIVVWAAACATGGGSAIPRGASRLAAGSTPEPVRFEVVVRGRRPAVRIRVVRLLTDSLFHVTTVDAGVVSGYNLARLTKVRVEVVPAGKDSMRVWLSGETYVGDTARRDSISGLPERWRLITAGDPSALLLRGLARALRTPRGEQSAAAAGEGGVVAGPPGGLLQGNNVPQSWQGPVANRAVQALLATTPVGRSVDVCRNAAVPAGWLILFWYRDQGRCTGLADQRYAGEPNVMRLEREW